MDWLATPLPGGVVAARQREGEWLAQLALVAATRWDRRVGAVGADGVVLVDSRSVEDGAHEVRVVDGAAVACTCWPHRRGWTCFHRMAVACRLWQEAMGLDLEGVPLRVLLPALLGVHLEPPESGRDALPERKLA